jgi:hypothetical protein
MWLPMWLPIHLVNVETAAMVAVQAFQQNRLLPKKRKLKPKPRKQELALCVLKQMQLSLKLVSEQPNQLQLCLQHHV